MKVADSTKALKDYLRSEYEREIARAKRQAAQTREEILFEYEQEGERKAAALLREAKKAAKREQTSTIASAKQEARRASQEALGELLAQIKALVLQREQAKPKKQREQLLARIQDSIREELKKRGYDQEEFTYEQDPQALAVRASTKDLLVEDGVQQRIAQQQDTIAKHLMEEANAD